MRCVRTARHRVDHQLRIAVVRRYQQRSAAALDRLINAPKLCIHRLHSLDGLRQFAGMPHHVRVGKVHDHNIEGRVLHRLDHRIGDASRAHLRRKIIGRDLLRRHQQPVLAREGRLDSAVEKVSHVRVFLRLRHAQIAQLRLRHHVRQQALHALGRNHHRQRELGIVLRHGDVVQIVRHSVARNRRVQIVRARQLAASIFRDAAVARQHPGNLPHPIGAVIEADANILVFDDSNDFAVVIDAYKRKNEFVRDAVVVALAHAGNRVGIRAALSHTFHHRVERLGLALPSAVAVHRIVAPAHTCDPAHAKLGDLLLQRLDISCAAIRHRVASVHKRMDKDLRQPLLRGHFQQRVQMPLMRMHAAVG